MKSISWGLNHTILVKDITSQHVVIGINQFGDAFILEKRLNRWGFGPLFPNSAGVFCNTRLSIEELITYKLGVDWKIRAFNCRPQAIKWATKNSKG